MKQLFYSIAILISSVSFAQVGIGTTSPQAALDITATDMGILVPRIALTDTQSAAPVTNPAGDALANGTLVYNTATAGTAPNDVMPGFYYWQGAAWVAVKSGATLDAAYDGTGYGAGRIITADAGPVTVNGTDGLFVTGALGYGQIMEATGEGTKMFFYPRKGAFRAGYVYNDEWSENNTGYGSASFGIGTRAMGTASLATGISTTASGNYSTAMGSATTASGLYSTAAGSNATAAGQYSTSFGYGTVAHTMHEFAIGRYNTLGNEWNTGTWSNSDRLLVVGNGPSSYDRSDALLLYKNGNLTISGSNAIKPGGGSWTATSDSRLKKEVKQFKDGLAQVLAIKPVTYHYNELSGLDTSKEYVGVIAQELQKIAPYMVGNFTKDGTEYLNVDSSAMTYMLINAVKELNSKLEDLEAKNKELNRQNERLALLEQAVLELSRKQEPNNETVKSE